tara:strand:+ start:7852 stop:9591 length:1740 start_codon:yes stop_codon:yes gene_type:complete
MENKRDYYLGNPNLPTENSKFEWTPKMLKELKKATQNLLYFAETFFYIVNLDRGREKINLHSCQKRSLRKMRDNRFFILLASRQIGKTTMMTIYTLWHACFNNDQRILIVANKEGTAKEIFSRIRMAYEELPNWLKPGVSEYGKESLKFTNGTTIGISTTTGTAARGQSINVLVLDELAFIEPHLVESFWKSVYPVISSSKKSKVFIASTANGTDNLFYKIWNGAIEETNGWGFDRILWNEIPGRDEKWQIETMRTIGSQEAFDQEFGCQFLSTGEMAINEEIFEFLKINCIKPKIIMEEEHYKIWREPDDHGIYVVGVDIAEGLGQNASVIQILDLKDLTNIEQVAVYHSTEINPYHFTQKLYEILLQWGSPPALIERNNCGAQVVEQLYFNLRYANVVTYGVNQGKIKNNKVGVLAHTNTKYRCITNMRYFVNELKSVNVREIETLREIKNFVKYPNGKWAAKPGVNMLDDRVMALGWALMVLDNEVVQRYYEVLRQDDNGRPAELKRYDYGVHTPLQKNWLSENVEETELDTVVFNEKFDMENNAELGVMKTRGWVNAGDFQTQRSYAPISDLGLH